MSQINQNTNGNAKRIFISIILLRVIATILITNTHYGQIWPTSKMAVGGLLGDLLFFCISGFCLSSAKKPKTSIFFKKRVLRIYPSVIIITLILIALGQVKISGWFGRMSITGIVFPTIFHFIESILFLYILLFPCLKISFLNKRIPWIMAFIAVAFFITYILIDRTEKLDTATHIVTKFLFFEGMLYGVYLKQNIEKRINIIISLLSFVVFMVTYFTIKLFINENTLSDLQFLIFISLFFAGITGLRFFVSLESKLEKLPKKLITVLNFIASLTLEIYVVQSHIINYVVSLNLSFVPRFLITSIAIFICAIVLNYLSKFVMYLLSKSLLLIKKAFQKKAKL